MRKYILIILSIIILPLCLFSQQNPIRVEINWNSNEEPFLIAPCGNNGVMLFYSVKNQIDKNSLLWTFTHYDKNLTKIWTKTFAIHHDNKFQKYFYSDGILYVAFFNEEKSKTENNFELLVIDFVKEKINNYKGNLPQNTAFSSMAIADNKAFIGLTASKNINAFFMLSLHDSTWKAIDPDIKLEREIESVQWDSINKEILIVKKSFVKRDPSISITVFDTNGNLSAQIPLEYNNTDVEINSADVIATGSRQYLITGTFTFTNSKKSEIQEENAEDASGFYSVMYNQGAWDTLRYYNWASLSDNNSFNLTEDAIKNKIKNNNKRKQSKNNNYNIVKHPLIKYHNAYLLIAEAFYPEYHTERSLVYDYFGRPMTNTYSVFDGYRYSNGFILCFDKNGELLWDNGIEMWNILTLDIQKKLNISIDGDEIALAFSNEGKIAYKVCRGNEVIDNMSFTSIDALMSQDEIIEESSSVMQKWYGKYYLVSGYQKIRNNAMAENRRGVFYINKIAFE
ncbi:MAG: hypothetical protein M0R21_10625 [Lentimicrobiaceae bacterium]|nr:hypothetical protein [Lentimicrobiaceae bacterium]